jgi:hypothetical protein
LDEFLNSASFKRMVPILLPSEISQQSYSRIQEIILNSREVK